MANAETSEDADGDLAWAADLLERIRAIDERRESGIPREDVFHNAANLLDS